MPLASLDNQVVFKKLLQDADILKAFIKDLMGIDLQPQSIEVEKKFSPTIGGVDIEIDIFVDDPTHRLVLEIQRRRYDDDFDRFWYYHQAATLELVKNYKDYHLSRTVCTIVWFTRKVADPLYQEGLITTSLCSETASGKKLQIYPHKLYFINPFYPSQQISSNLADWMTLVTESITNPNHPNLNYQRSFMQKAIKLIDEDGLTPQERANIIDERAYENQLKKERKEGVQEGLQKGVQKGRLETAHVMLAKGYDLGEIAELTNLSIEEITTLKFNENSE